MNQTGTNLLKAAMQQMQLSARAYHRTQSVKLARTIADNSLAAEPVRHNQKWLCRQDKI